MWPPSSWPEGEEVDGGGQQAEPGGQGERVEAQDHAVGERPVKEARRQLHGQALRRAPGATRRRRAAAARPPSGRRRRAGTAAAPAKPASGPATPTSKSSRLVADRHADADEGAERAEHRGQGQEVGQGRRQPVAPAGQVVPHLVDEQDDQHRQRERQAEAQQRRVAPHPAPPGRGVISGKTSAAGRRWLQAASTGPSVVVQKKVRPKSSSASP